jgi:hypothetical protein
MLDVKRLISEVAARNGIRIDEDDPAFCLVTMNQVMLEEMASKIVDEVRTATHDFECAVEKVHKRAGVVIAEQVKGCLDAYRRLTVSDSARSRSSVRSDQIRWCAVGLFSGLLMFLAGVVAGMWFR